MDVNFTSTYLLNARLRDSIQSMQSELSRRQLELSTGRKHDIGLELGSLATHLVSTRRQIESIQQVQVTNGLVAERMTVMQDAMGAMVAGAQSMVDQLAVEMSDNLDRNLLSQFGVAGINDFAMLANTTFRGEYVFSGINTDIPAINDYAAGPQAAVRAAFLAEFGMLPDDPAVAGIDAAAMTAFLEGAYSDLFDDAGWQADWTGASTRDIRVKYSLSAVTELPGNANDSSMRRLAAGYAIMAELGGSAIGDETMNAVVRFAVERLSQGIAETTSVQSRLGVVENRVAAAGERLDYQEIILTNTVNALQGVDSYEVAMRINELLASIEASYAVTAKIRGLSIMDYL
ncbi:MAG: flagellin [Alphaproteobacteria bacterium]|nr:MAG: flagellin [Alphaproteobacteria bacterium]